MKTSQKTPTQGQNLVNRYSTYGLLGGTFFGLLVGVLVSGPRFALWPAVQSVAVIFGSGFVGGLLGYILPGMAIGSTTSGRGTDVSSPISTSDGGSSGYDSSSCSGGDGGSCGGGDA